jgi:hypothetical protein
MEARLSKTSDITLFAAAALIAIGTGSALAQSANAAVPASDGAVEIAPAAPETASRAGDADADDTNAYRPDQVTGVNGSGNPGATGPAGAHDSRSGNGWNAGPRSNIGGAHND